MVEWFKRLLVRWKMIPMPPDDVSFFEQHPEDHIFEMRQELRRPVHHIRGKASELQWESFRARKATEQARTVAHAAIYKIEEARKARESNAVPPN